MLEQFHKARGMKNEPVRGSLLCISAEEHTADLVHQIYHTLAPTSRWLRPPRGAAPLIKLVPPSEKEVPLARAEQRWAHLTSRGAERFVASQLSTRRRRMLLPANKGMREDL